MDETQKALGRIQATLEHQNDVLDELKVEVREVHEVTNEIGELARLNARQIDEHKKLDSEIAAVIVADLEPVKKHVTIWNGVIKTILFAAGAGGAIIAVIKVIMSFI